jgi:TonB family protein
MPITQIPFQDPVAPPEKPLPEQLGLYDQRDWETAYRDLDANVPHLLVQLQDDLTRSRRREAIWISVVVHLVLGIFLWQFKLIQDLIPWGTAVVVPVDTKSGKNVTFLALPPDLQKAPRRPNAPASDKNRIATTRHPELDPKELQRRLPSPPPGRPGRAGPRSPQPQAAPPQAMAQNQPPSPQQGQQPTQRPQFQSAQTPQQQSQPTVPNAFAKYGGAMTAGDAIRQATQGVAESRTSGGGQQGDFGMNSPAHGRQQGALEIMSDTQGVDFGPYLQRVLQEVKEHWYELIPESAEMKKGKLMIEFAIGKEGQVIDLKLDVSSGDVALDRPAWGSITGSNPFPPLPPEFHGPDLRLRFRFYYNPDKADME